MKNYLARTRKTKQYRLVRLALGTSLTLGIFVDLEVLAERLSSVLTVSWGGERWKEGAENKTIPHIDCNLASRQLVA